MVGSAPIAALLQRSGAIPGSDSSLTQSAQAMKEWVESQVPTQKWIRLNRVLQCLPEQQLVARAADVADMQRQIVQV